MAERYQHLIHIVDLFKPRSFIEIGTWNGRTAAQVLLRMNKYCTPRYIGYDLFESATAETDAVELNVKAHNTVESVRDYLRQIYQYAPQFDQLVKLVKGNTRETLKHEIADFAYIDGGHSIETIAHDYEALKHCPVVLLDDYYTSGETGNGPDTTKYGCNQLVKRLSSEGKRTGVFILPTKDPVAGGGFTQYVLVLNG